MAKESLSLGKETTMYGIRVRQLPIGSYLNAIKLLQDLPKEFMEQLFEGKTDIKLSDMLDITNLSTLIAKLLTVTPDFAIRVIAKLLEVDEDIVRNKLTPLQIIKIMKKFWELNELSDFFQEMKPMIEKIKEMITLIGFNEQSLSALKSE